MAVRDKAYWFVMGHFVTFPIPEVICRDCVATSSLPGNGARATQQCHPVPLTSPTLCAKYACVHSLQLLTDSNPEWLFHPMATQSKPRMWKGRSSQTCQLQKHCTQICMFEKPFFTSENEEKGLQAERRIFFPLLRGYQSTESRMSFATYGCASVAKQ